MFSVAKKTLVFRAHYATLHSVKFKIPEAAKQFGIRDGQVFRIFYKPGDRVEKGAEIVEVETDKITIHEKAHVGGILRSVPVKLYEKVVDGSILFLIENTDNE